MNSNKDRGKPDRLDKDYEPAHKNDENLVVRPRSKRQPKKPLLEEKKYQ